MRGNVRLFVPGAEFCDEGLEVELVDEEAGVKPEAGLKLSGGGGVAVGPLAADEDRKAFALRGEGEVVEVGGAEDEAVGGAGDLDGAALG